GTGDLDRQPTDASARVTRQLPRLHGPSECRGEHAQSLVGLMRRTPGGARVRPPVPHASRPQVPQAHATEKGDDPLADDAGPLQPRRGSPPRRVSAPPRPKPLRQRLERWRSRRVGPELSAPALLTVELLRITAPVERP